MYTQIIIATLLLVVSSSSITIPNVSASVVDYDDEPEEQELCEERSDYDFLCSGGGGVTGLPFCDVYNATERAGAISQ